jgi:hypothetical protein
MSKGKRKSRAWIWPATALGLLPLSFLMFAFGIVAAFPSPSDPILFRWGMELMLILSPCVALTGVIWLIVLAVRHPWEPARIERKSKSDD